MKKIYKTLAIVLLTLFYSKVTIYADMKFPTPEGQDFTWWTGYEDLWHTRSAIDIGSNSGEMNVVAVESGTIADIQACNNSGYVKILHSNGVLMEYFHLRKMDMEFDINSKNKSIKRGQYLGKLWKGNLADGNCGSAQQIAGTGHLHWEMPTTAVTIDGYVFDNPSKTACNSGGNCVGGGSVLPSTNKALVIYNGTVSGYETSQVKYITAREINVVADEAVVTVITGDRGQVELRSN